MTPQQYLIQQAQAAGVDPLNLATVMQYESGLNPARWGGKGGNVRLDYRPVHEYTLTDDVEYIKPKKRVY